MFAAEEHVEVEATWGIYRRIVVDYCEPYKNKGKQMMRAVIDAVSSGVPVMLTEVRRLGRTLKRRAADVLAFFDRPGTSNGPTEAINGRLKHLRGSARLPQPHHYIARSLLEAGGLGPSLHPKFRRGTKAPWPAGRHERASRSELSPVGRLSGAQSQDQFGARGLPHFGCSFELSAPGLRTRTRTHTRTHTYTSRVLWSAPLSSPVPRPSHRRSRARRARRRAGGSSYVLRL